KPAREATHVAVDRRRDQVLRSGPRGTVEKSDRARLFGCPGGTAVDAGVHSSVREQDTGAGTHSYRGRFKRWRLRSRLRLSSLIRPAGFENPAAISAATIGCGCRRFLLAQSCKRN